MAGQGVAAKFDGVCPACGVQFFEGEMVEKIPQHGDRRGHLACYRELNPQGARTAPRPQPRTPAAQPQAQAQGNVLEHPANRPATSGPRAQAPGFALDDETIHELWKMRDAYTEAAQGLMKAAVCLETIVKNLDPHQAKAHAPTEERRRTA